MGDTYPELRNDVAEILRQLCPNDLPHAQPIFDFSAARRRFGAGLLDYVESTESGDGALRERIGVLESELSEIEDARDAALGDLDLANVEHDKLRELVGAWAAQLDDLDVDSEARDDLRPIIAKMRAAVGGKKK